MARNIGQIVAHLRAVSANPSVSTTLIQTEDLLVLCDAAERQQELAERLDGIKDALEKQRLFAFENRDGTFSLTPR